jgi:cysteine desulfurase/selenocysteine lyase
MSQVLYNTGAVLPVEEVGRIAKQNNALFFIDAAQSVGTLQVDVKKIGCHFMAFPGFKWLCGPTGIGVFYCSKQAAEFLTPPEIGWESAILSDSGIIAYMEMPARFQTGFRNYAGAAGLLSSIQYILDIGIENVRQQNLKVANVLRSELAKIPSVKLLGPEEPDNRTSIVTFTASLDSSSIVKKLEAANIVLADRDIAKSKKGVRASPHFFNSEQESVQVAEQVKGLL